MFSCSISSKTGENFSLHCMFEPQGYIELRDRNSLSFYRGWKDGHYAGEDGRHKQHTGHPCSSSEKETCRETQHTCRQWVRFWPDPHWWWWVHLNVELNVHRNHKSLHCHHQNDFCIKMDSDESHFNVSSQATTCEEKGEPKRIQTEVPLLTSLTPYL